MISEEISIKLKIVNEAGLSVKVIDYEDKELRKKITNPNEILVKEEKIRVLFDYPLRNIVVFDFENKNGFSRMDLYKIIHETYKKIYDEENNAVGDPGYIPGMYNRAESNGPYKIYGHYIDDLYIEGIIYEKDQEIKLIIGS